MDCLSLSHLFCLAQFIYEAETRLVKSFISQRRDAALNY